MRCGSIASSGRHDRHHGGATPGSALLQARGLPLDGRADTYLVLPGRTDVGLKLRGGDEFEAKVLHQRSGGWELWEKCAFFRWNSIEAARLAAMLRVAAPTAPVDGTLAPVKGAGALLRDRSMSNREVTTSKTRIQALASELVDDVPGLAAKPGWLTELVEITLPGKRLVHSLCFETMDPLENGRDPIAPDGALRCGYPELLLKQLEGGL